ncbi:hypothetical protein [Oryzicola mucosus]|uniref:Uncharacterized protein n=1 Tax=Oryzicola mucosus TaxID=2767425 RepID=A0A8J6PIE6_9HYPH|nr:hypothetical protein [Oryzicola mucosus]MBD0414096.1 hypothetical protein [Oryzicola mucosus]
MLLMIGKLFHMLMGYVVATLAASAFLNLLFLGSAGFTAEEAGWVASSGSMIVSIPFVALFVSYFAFIPALVVMLLAEMMGKRDWLFYALGGALVGIVVVGYFYQVGEPSNELLMSGAPIAVIGSGIVGGLAYWFVTGRFAGRLA